jgi:Chemotaxis response regulator containing a CheY-like receiver domain and a methylesterase domain
MMPEDKSPRGTVRVLVVDDSAVVRLLLQHIISADRRLTVVGCAADAEQAMQMIRRLSPDIVTMDIRLPRMNGFEATRWIMREHPLPIVVVASNVDDKTLDISMNALRAGALTVVPKPSGLSRQDYQTMARHLCTQLVIMSQVKVVRQRAGGKVARVPPHPLAALVQPELVAMVASTGGPGALAGILGSLPADFPLPVVVVQHMGAPFMTGFAHWLDSVSALPVHVARDLAPLVPGCVFLAPGDIHLTVAAGQARLVDNAPVQGQRPSGDVLFDSVAAVYGRRAVGVVLTGMGEDGARGLAAMKAAGAHTIAEAQSSAVIWGMPGAAAALRAAVEELPLDAIPLRLTQLAGAPPRAEAVR